MKKSHNNNDDGEEKKMISRIGRENSESVDFLDFEGIGLERYSTGLNYLIRPDGYIAGIFKELDIKALKKCML